MSDLPTGRFFGFYLQSVDTTDGERRQYLVLPPVDMGPNHPYSGKICWWERVQFVSSQKPKWSFQSENSGTSFHDRVKPYLRNSSYITSEPFVVKVSELEVKEWIKERSTPYRFIQRLEKRAARKNIRIQGPTSKPQVVTAPPTS